MKSSVILLVFVSLFAVLTGCKKKSQGHLFELISPSESGVEFNNVIAENDTFNVLQFEYIYNGAGVGIGDFNHDSLPDIFFAGNVVSSKLYLNRGSFKFEDVTNAAQTTTNSWCTGVSVFDFNQDGWDDIYVSTAHPKQDQTGKNLLFVNKGLNNNGVPVFEEIASKAGIEANAYSTIATFIDYDNDRDLDMYLVTNSLERYPKNNPVGQKENGEGKSQDRLYRNDTAGGNIHFTDVSKEAGIQTEGWGLGVVTSDFNQDGYTDIFVTNDFLSNDHLYINQGNGTFRNEVKSYFTHTEFNGMGTDAADINNDGRHDIIAVDMFPDDNTRQKAMFSNIGYAKFQVNLKQNYQPQYVRNVLQLNNGNNTFSDVACMSGLSATDWSWSALMIDMDNDSWRDVFISNGYKKDITDLDFMAYTKENTLFGRGEDKYKNVLNEVNKLNGVKKNNFAFKNNRDLTFTNSSSFWGFDVPSYTNGVAYADFDRDGDLDLVMNNIDAPAFVYRNLSREKNPVSNFIQVKLHGESPNLSGLGAKLWIYDRGKIQFIQHTCQRGYLSTMEDLIHVGLGSSSHVDSIKILWPSGKEQIINSDVNKRLDVYERNATRVPIRKQPVESMFNEGRIKYRLEYKHEEEDFVDFKQVQPLLLHKFSQGGPAVAVGDIDGDRLQDVIIGASAQNSATIFQQKQNQTFANKTLMAEGFEDTDLILFDADNDKDLDLLCVSGSNEYYGDSPKYNHRVYQNDGKGNFSRTANAIGENIRSSGSCASVCDYDKDGDLDVFIGSRVVPGKYPISPASFLLNNQSKDGNIRFAHVEDSLFRNAGLITDAVWADFDGDTWPDLFVVGEWMPLTVFKNYNGTLKRFQSLGLPREVGWWRCIRSGDFDKDGDLDFVAGNFGLNSLYQATKEQPMRMYVKDFDGNNTVDPIVCRYIQGKEYPTHFRETMTEQMVSMKKVLTSYSKYGKSTLEDILTPAQREGAELFEANFLASAYIKNTGNGFEITPLPTTCQTSPVNDMLVEDIDNDGNLDVIGIQNDFSFEPVGGWYDAGYGFVLKGNGKGGFTSLDVSRTGFCVRGDAKAISEVKLPGGKSLYLVTQNQDSLKVFERVR
jgi:enediyne biosynthesis protein E4